MAELNIDGRMVPFNPGESVIQVATRIAVEIPHYCWHPRLSVAANCRMCLVEVEKAPKLVPACQTECKEGMVVHTQSERVRTAQHQVHEFLLINHPIDCPICDQAGECKLQDYYMRYQHTPSRMREPKVHKTKSVPLGPRVMYNAQRCVMCTRCVRFMEEVPKERQLGVIGRGDHSTIGCAEGETLDSAYSLNTVDVCPVGALTSSVFRFKQRVWNLRRTPSVCGGCSKGCNVQVDQRSSQVYRLLPRENQDVNQSWLCDDGRLTYNRSNVDRIVEPLVRDGDFLRPTTVGEATDTAIRRLAPHVTRPERLAVVLTLHATNEEALAAARFVAAVGAQPKLYALGYAPGDADALLRQADKNPNREGIRRVAQSVALPLVDAAALQQDLSQDRVSAVLVVGSEAEALEDVAQAIGGLDAVVHITFARTPLSDVAHVMLPSISWVQNDGTWLSGDLRLQALTPAFPPADQAKTPLMWLDTLAQGLGKAAQAPSTPAWQAELSAETGAFAGVNFAALGAQGLSLSEPPLQASA